MNNIDLNIQRHLNSKITRKILENIPGLTVAGDKQIRLLLCLPFDYVNFFTALKVFLPVIRKYRAVTRIVVPQAFFPIIKEIEPELLVPLIATRIDKEGFPTDPDISALIGADLAVAIDLNVVPTTASAFIVARSQARIKVGFQTEFSEDLFNLIISYKKENLVENAYNRIWTLVQPEISKSL